MTRARRFAWIAMVVSDAGLLAWGAMAALAPDHLLGPGSTPILAAGYEGFTGRSWQELMAASPGAAAFMVVLFRVYGAYIVAFGLLALAMAATAFELTEYVGLALVYGALAVAAPFVTVASGTRAHGDRQLHVG